MEQPPSSLDAPPTESSPRDREPIRPPFHRLAIASLFCALLLPPVGLVLAVVALVRIARAREPRRGRGLAIASLVVSIPGAALTGFLIYEVATFDLDFQLDGLNKTTFDPAAMPGHALVCSAPTDAAVTSAATIADGALYVRDARGRVDAFDAHTCPLRWTVATGGGPLAGVDFAPVVASGAVYVTGWDGSVRALDAATGATRWSTSTRGIGGVPLSVANGLVYVDAGGLRALDATTGQTRWSVSVASLYSKPVVADGVVFASDNEAVHAYDAGTGALRWSRQPIPPTANGARPGEGLGIGPSFTLTAAGDAVYAAGHGGSLYQLDAATGVQRWAARIGAVNEFGSTAVVANGTVYVDTDALYAFDAAAGTARWVTPTGPPGSPNLFGYVPPVVSSGVVYVAGGDALLHAVDATTGAPRWVAGRVPPPKPDSTPLVGTPVVAVPPAVSDGILYVGSGDARVYAYRL
jgi:outer membrane protein assembly factor BamB